MVLAVLSKRKTGFEIRSKLDLPIKQTRKIITGLSSMCNWANILKTVVDFRRNLLIRLVVLPQYNYHKITVPPIRWLKIWQDIALRIYFNRWSVDSVKKKGGVSIGEDTCGGFCGLFVQIFIAKIIFGENKKEYWLIITTSRDVGWWVWGASCCR